MKKDIHPKVHPVVFVDLSSDAEYITTSTLKSDEIRKIDGVDHYVIKAEVTAASHPFFTGTQKLLDSGGRVNKFNAKREAAAKHKEKMLHENDEVEEEVKQAA